MDDEKLSGMPIVLYLLIESWSIAEPFGCLNPEFMSVLLKSAVDPASALPLIIACLAINSPLLVSGSRKFDLNLKFCKPSPWFVLLS